MKLSSIKKGESVKIMSIPDENIRVQAIRIGLYEGAKLVCFEKIPSGPVILKNRFQEIAIGRNLANSIVIEAV
ncbi:ferrous iron transport protein A [Peptostreptococcaceae bacterium AGR-M142]